MSHYGISQIKWDSSHSFIEQVKLHQVIKRESGEFGLDEGTVKQFHETSSLINAGNKVYVLVPDGPGDFKLGDKVTVKTGQQEFLESVNEMNQPTSALYDLVAWND